MARKKVSAQETMKIKITRDGPYCVTGGVPLHEEILVPDRDGLSTSWRRGKVFPLQQEYELCRCGQSRDKPFCDGTHETIEFDGTETASREPVLLQAEPVTAGPQMDLIDVPVLCALARFCDRAGGAWDNTRHSDDPQAKEIALQEVRDCPAGRLMLRDKDGKAIEPKFTPSVAVVIDPVEGVIGPLWVRGGIPVEAVDGTIYEIRNRVTLCRCGLSTNKPYCDGKHVETKPG